MPQVEIDELAWARLEELRRGWAEVHPDDPKTREWLVEDAIRRVHRGFVGLPHNDPEAPTATGRFQKWASERGAEVLIRQVDATEFRLAQPFRIQTRHHLLEVRENNVTDLASVPRWCTWLIPRYGRHTLAALLHDSLQPARGEPWPDPPPHGITSEDADELFRDTMGDTGVPLVRRWVMWAAVALRTEVRFATASRTARALVWAIAFGIVALALWPALLACIAGWGGWRRAAELLGLALAAPIVLSPVWGRRWRLGVIAGVSLLFLVVPILLVLLALAVYGGAEWVGERFVRETARNPIRTAHLEDPG